MNSFSTTATEGVARADGTPAAEGGVRPGDEILSVNGVDVKTWPFGGSRRRAVKRQLVPSSRRLLPRGDHKFSRVP
jgi:C-terminal processing protease CtpA/Prc